MLARLLSLEGKAALRLTHWVARVADVALPAARVQPALGGEDGGEVVRTFARVLVEMDAEKDAADGGQSGNGGGEGWRGRWADVRGGGQRRWRQDGQPWEDGA